jgi:hypothetical protein
MGDLPGCRGLVITEGIGDDRRRVLFPGRVRVVIECDGVQHGRMRWLGDVVGEVPVPEPAPYPAATTT